METHARYFLIGAFSLSIVAILLLFALWLGKLELGKEYQDYDIRFKESVAGLAKGGLVQFQGVQVGEVRRLKLDANDPRVVVVRVRMTEQTPIKTDTKAQLSFTGLTGVALIELIGGTPEAKLLRDTSGKSVPIIPAIPSTLTRLMVDGTSALKNAEALIERVTLVFSEANIQSASNTLDNLETLSVLIKQDYPRIPGVVDEAKKAITEMREAGSAINRFAKRSTRAVAGFESNTSSELSATLISLRQASDNLVRITEHFDAAPAEYLLGREALPSYTPEAKPQ